MILVSISNESIDIRPDALKLSDYDDHEWELASS